MKYQGYKHLMILPLLFSGLFAQTEPDLVLKDEITPEYITYLLVHEVGWLIQVGGGDSEATMKAHMGLAILSFAWSHVDGDTMIMDLEPIFDAIEENVDSLANQIEEYIVPIFDGIGDIYDLLTNLTNFFNSGDFSAFRDSLKIYMDDIEDEIDNGVIPTIEDFFEDLEGNFEDEHFSDHIDAIADGTAEFEFALQVLGSSYEDTLFIFSRDLFNRVDNFSVLGEEMGNNFDDAVAWMDSVMSITGGDVMPGVNLFRAGFTDMIDLIDSLKVILTNHPFAPFEIDVAPLDSLRDVISEIDTLLGGKEYEFGPSEEGKTIKPLAIIQNIPGDGLQNVYMDFYRTSSPAIYTFGGIFPDGLDSLSLDLISADAVFNDWDDLDTLEAHLLDLKEAWEMDLANDPFDPDAHLGLAIVSTFEIIRDHINVYEDAFRLLDEGRIDSLTFYYDWDNFDIFDEIEEIDDHMGYYVESEDLTHFIFLVKTEPDDYEPYEIGPSSEFDVIHLPVPVIFLIREELHLVGAGLELIVDGISALYDELSEIFILDLDPTVLDFSNVESDSDFILILEQSNPDFLTVTPYGIEQFHEAGDMLEDGVQNLNKFFVHMVDLAYAMEPYEDDFDMDGTQFIADMEDMEYHTWEVWQDFAYPDSVTIINDERVNLSAWFDDPPTSFLLMWKYYVFGIDSTLGGLFPDRPGLGISPDGWVSLPKIFEAYLAYPNPFNPWTNITFDIPKVGHVTVTVYNIIGERVATLVDKQLTQGKKHLIWNATEYASGLYFYQIDYDGIVKTHKMILLK
ncbi:MAG: T9SS type A sorting domain-containing protein [Candidatus Marinimicrobia bacterium]|nr:T9SS type A sorting domain-containing protein [Candidatus Neomarinimicrobiota bacterium]